MNVSVSGGKSEAYGVLGLGAPSLVNQNLETISAQCPLLHSKC